MKNKNDIRYLELIFSVFSAKDCTVEEGGNGIGHGCRFVRRTEEKRTECEAVSSYLWGD